MRHYRLGCSDAALALMRTDRLKALGRSFLLMRVVCFGGDLRGLRLALDLGLIFVRALSLSVTFNLPSGTSIHHVKI